MEKSKKNTDECVEDIQPGKKMQDPRQKKIDVTGNYGIDGVSHSGDEVVISGKKPGADKGINKKDLRENPQVADRQKNLDANLVGESS